ncbi:hypothetical protein Tco_0567115 [Tanacetum coccineum]
MNDQSPGLTYTTLQRLGPLPRRIVKLLWFCKIPHHETPLECGFKEKVSLGRMDQCGSHMRYKVSDGKSISVWHDKWNDGDSLSKNISKKEIYYVGFHDQDKLVDVMNTEGWQWPTNCNGILRIFSTNTVWKDVRGNNAKFTWNTLGKEPVLQDPGRPISDEALREYYDRNYHQILPVIAEKLHQEKVQQEKLKAVKARLNFEETLHYSELGTPIRRRGLKERLGSRYVRSRSRSPEPRHGRSESPKKKGSKRKTVYKRLEKGVFHRLEDKGKNVFMHSDDSRHWSHQSIRRDTESCHKSSRSKATESASERRYNKRVSSRRTEELLESEGSVRGHWKSKLKRQKSSIEDDLSQP